MKFVKQQTSCLNLQPPLNWGGLFFYMSPITMRFLEEAINNIEGYLMVTESTLSSDTRKSHALDNEMIEKSIRTNGKYIKNLTKYLIYNNEVDTLIMLKSVLRMHSTENNK